MKYNEPPKNPDDRGLPTPPKRWFVTVDYTDRRGKLSTFTVWSDEIDELAGLMESHENFGKHLWREARPQVVLSYRGV